MTDKYTYKKNIVSLDTKITIIKYYIENKGSLIEICKGNYKIKNIINMRYVAILFGVSKSSVSNWFRLYKNNKLIYASICKYNKTRLTEKIITYINKYIKRNPFLNHKKLISNLKKIIRLRLVKVPFIDIYIILVILKRKLLKRDN